MFAASEANNFIKVSARRNGVSPDSKLDCWGVNYSRRYFVLDSSNPSAHLIPPRM